MDATEKKYFYIDVDKRQQGPVSMADLRSAGVTPESKIWYAGLSDWSSAADLPELAPLFTPHPEANSIPPAYSESPRNTASRPNRPDSGLVWAILATLFCCIITGIVAIIYASRVDSYYNRGDYENAENAAKTARTWIIVSIVSGVLTYLGYLLLVVFSATTGVMMMNSF